MARLEHEGTPIDELSQTILQVIRDRCGSARARELRDRSSAESNEQIHYRYREYLGPPDEDHPDRIGFLEQGDAEDVPGAANAARIYELTDRARDWLDDHTEDITDAVDAAKAVKSLRRTRQTLDELTEQVDSFEDRMDGWQKTMNRRSRRLSELNNRVDEAADVRDEAWNKAHAAEQDVDQLRDDLDDLRNDLTGLAEDIAAVEQTLEDERRAREQSIKRLGDWAEQEIGRALREAQQARQEARAAQRSLLDQVLDWFWRIVNC